MTYLAILISDIYKRTGGPTEGVTTRRLQIFTFTLKALNLLLTEPCCREFGHFQASSVSLQIYRW